MRYYLIAGEPSGDLHGTNLMRGILKADADAVFRFWGGDMMAAAGGAQNLAKHYRDTSFFGIAEVVHGAAKGLVLSVWRILRCNPFGKGGYDPVPEKGRWKSDKRNLFR